MNQQENRTWLIRYPNFSFSRPLSDVELKKMFSSGEMKPQDEICMANGYWFSLQDVKEMRKHFGDIPLDGIFKKINEEVTQERYAVTASIVVPAEIKAALVKQKVEVAKQVDSTPQSSALTKILLVILTMIVLILLFVWFG